MSEELAGQVTPVTPETAAEPGQTAEQKPETVEADAPEKETPEERRFTQAELDKQIRLRVAREQRKYERRLGEMESQIKSIAPTSTPSQPVAEPKLDDFKDYESYQKALIRHEAEKLVADREQQRTQRESTTAQQQRMAELSRQFEAREESARELYDDYDEVIALIRPGTMPPHVVEAIGESDVGPQLLYKLASEPKLAAEIARLSSVGAVKRLAALESEIAGKQKPKSNAPDPVRPLSGRAADASDLPSDKDDVDTWVRKERARMAKLGLR